MRPFQNWMRGLLMGMPLIGLPLYCGAQSVSFNRPGDAIHYRQGLFTVMSAHTQKLSAMVKGQIPFDKQTAEQQTLLIDLLGKQMQAAFPPGSDQAPSKAKPEIWQDPAAFKIKQNDFQNASAQLLNASRTGDLAALQSALGRLSQTCKSCHDGYRNR